MLSWLFCSVLTNLLGGIRHWAFIFFVNYCYNLTLMSRSYVGLRVCDALSSCSSCSLLLCEECVQIEVKFPIVMGQDFRSSNQIHKTNTGTVLRNMPRHFPYILIIFNYLLRLIRIYKLFGMQTSSLNILKSQSRVYMLKWNTAVLYSTARVATGDTS
jgi:hypothetical protein